MRLFGLIVIVASLAAPAFGFAMEASRDPLAVFSQYLGATALIAMAWSQLIATRWRVLEIPLGGLDRQYVLHKWLGIAAMAAVLLHDTIDAEMQGLGRETLLVEVAETLGEISLYGLLILVTVTLATFVPYHFWRISHKFVGGFFALSALHYLFILKPFENDTALGLYIAAFCVLGVVCYAVTLLRRDEQPYTVAAVDRSGDSLSISLAPVGRAFRHNAGQFAFLRFAAPDISEAHPFTIGSAPRADGSLRFGIKPCGDWTRRLSAVEPGAKAFVSGPHGRFGQKDLSGQQVWVAAGIGITPFLAKLEDMVGRQVDIDLFYCVRDRAAAPYLNEVEAAAAAVRGVRLHIVESAISGRLRVETVGKAAGVDSTPAHVLFCGPEAMRREFAAGLTAMGLPARRFHYEEFRIRSGLPLVRLAGWIFERFRRDPQRGYAGM